MQLNEKCTKQLISFIEVADLLDFIRYDLFPEMAVNDSRV